MPPQYLLALLLASTAPSALGQPAPTLENCFLEKLSSTARCGTLAVPLDHSDPDGPSIDLHLAILPAVEQPARPDPVVILAGGPGQSAISIAVSIRRSMRELNRERDIVLMDQRGTGASTPLTCELDLDELGFDDAAKGPAIERCLESLPADPRFFGTVSHINDLEFMRGAFGYEQVNLYGGSYGTRAGLVYLREYPASVRTATLDAVAPLDMRIGLEMGADAQPALDRLFADCAVDADCSAAYPDLAGRFATLRARLADGPQLTRFRDPGTGQLLEEEIDYRHLALGIRALLYSPTTRRALPPAIDAAADGDLEPLLGLATANTLDLMDMMTPGLLLAVLCTEDLAGLDAGDIPERERASFVGTAQIDEFLGYCRHWPAPLEPMNWSAPETDVPVLLLSGALDPVTPPARAEAAARTLGESRHVVVPAGGHTVASLPCVAGIVTEFIESADPNAPDAACVDEIPLPTFFTSLLGPTAGGVAR